MSKSNKKPVDRLKDSCRHERLRSDRHLINQLLKEQRFDELDEFVEDDFVEEDLKKRR